MLLGQLQKRAKTEPVSAAEIEAVMAEWPADERMIHWSPTGVPLSTLVGNKARNEVGDVRGGFIGREFYVHIDYRLHRVQRLVGVGLTPIPEPDLG